MNVWIEQLARKALNCPHKGQLYRLACLECVAAAIQEALVEAEKIPLGRGCTKVACGPNEHSYAGCPQNIAAAIATLYKEGYWVA